MDESPITGHGSRSSNRTKSAVLYVAISPHGFGHIAQTAPVVNELFHRNPHLRVVIETTVPREVLAARFEMPFTYVPYATDFGMVMHDAFSVAADESHARYLALHADLERHIAEAAYRIVEHRPNLVLCNIPYVPIVAAKRLGIPAVAMCCLNWADIYTHVCGSMSGAARIYEEILQAYKQADKFIMPVPTMPMPALSNTISSGPVATIGERRRDEIVGRLRLPMERKLVMISMGGIATALNLARWPVVPGITWLIDGDVPAGRTDMASVDKLNMRYLDAMCSSDALITKPGYGAFAETACNGISVVYAPRHDWPEARYLTEWLHAHARCAEMRYEELSSDRLADALASLWSQPERLPVAPTGVAQAADIIEALLRRVKSEG